MSVNIIQELKNKLADKDHLVWARYGFILLKKKFDYIYFISFVGNKCYFSGIYLGGIIGDISGKKIEDEMQIVKKEIVQIVSKYDYHVIKLYI